MANLFVHILRAIGQASMTKEYLESVRQGEVCLPDGPVFLNPDSLIHALKREVGKIGKVLYPHHCISR